jgi:phosphoribosylaminoimidazole carboxylase/phosphoribosylaminoimidazole-succinocarboxamide synthase
MGYTKGPLVSEGKTKVIYEALPDTEAVCRDETESFDRVIVTNKSAITAFDNPAFTKEFEAKGKYATATTSRVFEFLKKCGLPVAFREQLSETEFLAERCEMIPLEVVIRRYAPPESSFVKRRPDLRAPEGELPYRFHRLEVEFFLKTTKGSLATSLGKILVEGLDREKGEEDPLILDPQSTRWKLYHAKKPAWEPAADLKRTVDSSDVLRDPGHVAKIDHIARKVFLALEGAWQTLGYRFIDLKIEFGIKARGELMVADVIDSDSWRLRNSAWEDFSKESFRQGKALSEVEEKYRIVSELTERFQIPAQVIVLWLGSPKDSAPVVPAQFQEFCAVEEIVLSGHKAPNKSTRRLEELLTQHLGGGVILAKVGMSNGLGPTLAARTSWPVISVPTGWNDFPEDVWSSLRTPSDVPMGTILSDGNAVNYALNILAQKNPGIYMLRQLRLEELDD